MCFLPLVTKSCPELRKSCPRRVAALDRYGELVGENSISPGKPCEMYISPYLVNTTKNLDLEIELKSA